MGYRKVSWIGQILCVIEYMNKKKVRWIFRG